MRLATLTETSSIITLYQRLAFHEPDESHSIEDARWQHAISRCLSACTDMSEHLRHVQDSCLERSSPLVSLYIFNAARYLYGKFNTFSRVLVKILIRETVYGRILRTSLPRNIDLLVFSLKICASRWSLARRLVKVLEQASIELSRGETVSELPFEFWNLQYSSIDIDEALRKWAGSVDPWDHMVGLNKMGK